MTRARVSLVTGGAGFLGSHLVEHLLARSDDARVVVLDALTYAAHPHTVAWLDAEPRVELVRGDVTDRAAVRDALAAARPDVVFHLAAETHVDRSIDAAGAFVRTNVTGTLAVLDELRAARGRGVDARLVHVSTDEVFGSLAPGAASITEATPYAPRSPYAASKAAADHLVAAYVHTHGVPAIVAYPTNAYGPRQFPEKLIPRAIAAALSGEPIPIYGSGAQERDWIAAGDVAAALVAIARDAQPGARYLVGAREPRANLDLVHAICDTLDSLAPRADSAPHRAAIAHVSDRPGHDARYAADPARIARDLGWRAATALDGGLRDTVAWYVANPAWLAAIPAAEYRARLGLGERV